MGPSNSSSLIVYVDAALAVMLIGVFIDRIILWSGLFVYSTRGIAQAPELCFAGSGGIIGAKSQEIGHAEDTQVRGA